MWNSTQQKGQSTVTPLKWYLMGIAGLLLLIQFVGPERTNPAVEVEHTLQARLEVPPRVNEILNRACSNCHSHTTRWPWYSRVAPVSWVLIDDVSRGRSEMNFSTWGTYERKEQIHLLEEMCELVEKREMPLDTYLWVHQEAHLTDEEIHCICEWSREEQKRLLNEGEEPPNTEPKSGSLPE